VHKFVTAAVLGLLTLLLAAGPASAHAGLAGSNPEDGARLQTLPSSVTFTFSENVGNAFIAVTAPDGSAVEISAVSAVDREISASLTDPDQKGVYSASYRIVSADGHPVAGTITFTVLTGQEVSQVAVDSTQESFFDRHLGHVMWGVLAGLAAIALIAWPMRRRDDPHDA
jgi:methionine-rich copper-binding protein CopC